MEEKREKIKQTNGAAYFPRGARGWIEEQDGAAIIELRLKARSKSNEGIKWTDQCKSSRMLHDTLR